MSQAALINGSASHALDYDDTLASFLGHPSVTLFPSLLALGEWQEKSGEDFLAAYLIGLQVGITIAQCAGMEHYMAGWHGTSTIGHLASAAGCSWLLGLDAKHRYLRLGCECHAVFGPQTGVRDHVQALSRRQIVPGRSHVWPSLAQQGFTSAEDVLEGPHGFFQVLHGKGNEEPAARLGKEWGVEDLSQRYHASCHATHSPLEATLTIVEKEKVSLEEIERIHVQSSQLALDAAGKEERRPGSRANSVYPTVWQTLW